MAELIQVVKGTSVTVTVTFELNGVGQDLDSGLPVVTLTRPDGTAGPASGTVTNLPAAGEYSFVVAAQPECIWLDYAAVGTIGSQPQTLTGRIEWLGDALFNISSFRALRVANGTPFSLSAVPLYSDRQIMDTRSAVLAEMQDILGFAPVARFARETHDSTGSGIVLRERKPLRLLTVTVAGTAQDVDDYDLHPAGILRTASGYLPGASFPYGQGSVTVEYVHGEERPDGNTSRMAMLWAAAELNPSGFSSASTVSMPDGSTYTYEPSETGRGGFQRFTGIRDVDRWLNRHRAVAGVA